MRFLGSRVSGLIIAVALCLVLTSMASAREVQLIGIRLGDHAVNLLDIYGTPDGIAVGAGSALSAAQAPGPAATAPQMAGPMDSLLGALGGAMGSLGAGPGSMPSGPPPGAPGAPEATATAVGGGTATGTATEPFPIWATPVWVDLNSHEVEWVYNKGPVVMGFVLDRDGFVKVIAVAAERCDYARTALWRPHQYIKLGDDFKRVLYRYGYPDDLITFTSTGPGDAAANSGTVSVTFGSTTRTFSRDCVLRYTRNNNVEFTLHDMRVTRIHIWQ